MVDLRTTLQDARHGRPLLMVVPGSGLIARCAVESRADALMVLNAGVYRSMGSGTLAAFLPFGNANDQTEKLLCNQILPRSGDIPVIAGVHGVDPTCPLEDRLRRLASLGVAGVVNWPAVGFIDGVYREVLEEEGLGADAEAEMLRLARQMGFVTFGFALSVREVEKFVDAEVDGLVLDVGLTRSSDDNMQVKRDCLHQAIAHLNQLSVAADARPECVRVAFGGPITTPVDLREVFRHSAIHGFAGGSVFERLPVEEIVTTTLRQFQSVAASSRGGEGRSFGGMVGRSPAMRQVFDIVNRVAPQDVTVCIEGESGTGKELVAAMLHRLSPRSNHPFVTLNCGAIPESLLESELFGHERGAFTGAERRRAGKFELAHGGTLFLDEIADLSPQGQVALLRVLQQREVVRVGGEETVPVDVRIITASNRSLEAMVASGDFRADLFYRLSAIQIRLPSLRSRQGDIPLLVDTILAGLSTQLNRQITGVSTAFERRLRRHSWPGNIRELEQTLLRCAILEDGSLLEGWAFDPGAATPVGPSTDDQRELTRRELAQQALRDANGNKSRAAAALNITRKTLYRWLEHE
ncbi:Transcriptional regulatory protein ZraR [Maioricimonas rarisocia]|uniref:Transcriptional regulatory protein ZraR n=1 Tax=Maioricimonas rarisocia TaxID=2528026 RepID=A0A517ZAW2_9PLAN|nr:phosphoenolpyruvate hydrolase family protein [Maioricimonas rarisocia]QDU39597.1 Transcriptional regulatory protein ZraR [Maioricimonas rarisocia]